MKCLGGFFYNNLLVLKFIRQLVGYKPAEIEFEKFSDLKFTQCLLNMVSRLAASQLGRAFD
jgi:hypothetical protein